MIHDFVYSDWIEQQCRKLIPGQSWESFREAVLKRLTPKARMMVTTRYWLGNDLLLNWEHCQEIEDTAQYMEERAAEECTSSLPGNEHLT